MQSGDTIVAISSAVGAGAARIIVRMSGPDATRIARDLLAPTETLPTPSTALRCRLRFRDINFPAWVYHFQSPRSVTGEDVIELHLPGSALLSKLILNHLIEKGARQADPGE